MNIIRLQVGWGGNVRSINSRVQGAEWRRKKRETRI